QENRQVGLHCSAGGNDGLSKQITQGATFDRGRWDLGEFSDQTQKDAVENDQQVFILLRLHVFSKRTEQLLVGVGGLMLQKPKYFQQQIRRPEVVFNDLPWTKHSST